MKRAIPNILILVFAIGTLFSAAGGQSVTDREVITILLDEFLDGAGRNDRLIHDKFWADDLIYTSSTGKRFGKPELMKGVIESPTPGPGDPSTVYTAADVDIRIYGNIAVVAFRLVSTTTTAGRDPVTRNNLNTGTFIKRDDRWQAIAWQSTIIPDNVERPATLRQMTRGTANPPRNYVRGSNGGCYYVNARKRKVYVDRSLCRSR